MEFLKENADAFLRNAERLLKEGEFKLGDFPKIRSLKKLFRLFEENTPLIGDMEFAMLPYRIHGRRGKTDARARFKG